MSQADPGTHTSRASHVSLESQSRYVSHSRLVIQEINVSQYENGTHHALARAREIWPLFFYDIIGTILLRHD